MDKKKQKLVSMVIGLVLALLLVVIGVRVIQRRASRASAPQNFSVSRVSETSCLATWTSEHGDVSAWLVRYGENEGSMPFFHRPEEPDMSSLGDGTYQIKTEINNLSENKINFVIEGYEEARASCDPYTGSAGSEDSTAGTGLDIVQDDGGPINTPPPTSVPEPTEEPEPTKGAVIVKSALSKADADAFFNEQSDAGNTVDVTDCWDNFGDDYISYVQPCAEAAADQ